MKYAPAVTQLFSNPPEDKTETQAKRLKEKKEKEEEDLRKAMEESLKTAQEENIKSTEKIIKDAGTPSLDDTFVDPGSITASATLLAQQRSGNAVAKETKKTKPSPHSSLSESQALQLLNDGESPAAKPTFSKGHQGLATKSLVSNRKTVKKTGMKNCPKKSFESPESPGPQFLTPVKPKMKRRKKPTPNPVIVEMFGESDGDSDTSMMSTTVHDSPPRPKPKPDDKLAHTPE
jgi:hypothetical protein